MNKFILTLSFLFTAALTFAQPAFWFSNVSDNDLYVSIRYQPDLCSGEGEVETQLVASDNFYEFTIPPGYMVTVVSVYSFADATSGIFYNPCEPPCGADNDTDYWPSWDCSPPPHGIEIDNY